MALAGLLTAALLALATYTDLSSRKIPNWLTLGGVAAGLALHAVASGSFAGLLGSAAGLAAGFCLMLPPYALRAVGAGDVKLFAAIGALTGATYVASAAVYAIVCAGAIGIAIMLARKQFVRRAVAAGFALFGLLALKDVAGFKAYRAGDLLTFPFMLAVVPACALAACDRL